MGVDISLVGMGDLIDELERMGANISKVEGDALRAGAAPILSEAQQTTAFHDRTGDLRKSLSLSGIKSQKGMRYILAGSFDKKVFYGRPVEFGTSKSAPHPFLAPAFERHKAEAQEIIANKLREALSK
jgi:HK97 gp10 family phage protein